MKATLGKPETKLHISVTNMDCIPSGLYRKKIITLASAKWEDTGVSELFFD